MCAGLEKVFEVGPVFRADRSHTTRHLAEFTGFDVEISFIESEEELMRFEEEMIAHAITKVKHKHGGEIQKLFGFELKVPMLPFPRVSMEECTELLKEKGISEAGDLSSEGEKAIGEIVKEKYQHEFVFVTGYAYTKRPFYHMKKTVWESAAPFATEESKSSKHSSIGTKSFELLYSGMEITTGSQREHRYKVLKQQAIEKGLALAPLESYLSFFKYGAPPHGGFGIGISRILQQLLRLETIREAVLVTRTEERLTP
jgi:aspartyl-tRNA synthetase